MKGIIRKTASMLTMLAVCVMSASAFVVRLESFDQSKKIAVIKAVKSETGLGLSDSKKLVESAPVDLKKGLTEEEADKMVTAINEAGGKTFKQAEAGDTPSGSSSVPVTEKSVTWKVTLKSIDSSKKVQVIKVVRTATGLGLAESKNLVENTPQVIKTGLSLESAEKLVADLNAAGGNAEKASEKVRGSRGGSKYSGVFDSEGNEYTNSELQRRGRQ